MFINFDFETFRGLEIHIDFMIKDGKLDGKLVFCFMPSILSSRNGDEDAGML